MNPIGSISEKTVDAAEAYQPPVSHFRSKFFTAKKLAISVVMMAILATTALVGTTFFLVVDKKAKLIKQRDFSESTRGPAPRYEETSPGQAP